ncbi:methyltransferase [Streptomyces sp. CSDS2]|uniref:methyltransferase n=1 Tax=Streptomyces sp. CSDS2 TaxID=3055051 RepID=UPI0025B1B01E|nr:methyltransferase [Streptomyces sp. CSDS2]MDN3259517.1 methyltransferase [Streptomyces sp. CSDS2]
MNDVLAAHQFAEAVSGLAPVALRAAATLRLADHIIAGHDRLPALAEQAGADPDLLERLLRFLVCRQVFDEPRPGVYGLTGLSIALLDGHPSRLRSWLDQSGIGSHLDAATTNLLQALRTGRPPYAELHGKPFYEHLASHPAGVTFDGLRGNHAESFATELVKSYPWPADGHVVDLGAGTGVLLDALMSTCPRLRATLLDLPEAVRLATERLTAAGHGDRFTAMAASFFEPLPPGDIYTLVNVLHNWSDDDAVRILRGCARAAAQDTLVLVVERLLDEGDPYAMTAMDLGMFLFVGGRERTLGHYQKLASAAGLAHVETTEVPSGLRILTFTLARGCSSAD